MTDVVAARFLPFPMIESMRDLEDSGRWNYTKVKSSSLKQTSKQNDESNQSK